MSLILDALNKSDQERPGGQEVPGLQTDHGAAVVQDPVDWRKFSWPIAACVFAVVAITLWIGGYSTPERVSDVDGVSRAPEQQAPAAALPQESLPVEAVSAPVLQTGLPPDSLPDMPAETSGTETGPASRPVDADVAMLYAQSTADTSTVGAEVGPQEPEVVPGTRQRSSPESQPDTSQNTGLDVDLLAQAAQSELEKLPQQDEPLIVHGVPLINGLKQSLKDEIPSVFFTMHHWSSIAREREVVLNGETRHEGDIIKPGLRLLEILEDSIVMDYRGNEFRLRSLNSWVNL